MAAFFETIKTGDKVKYFDTSRINSISEKNLSSLNLIHTITKKPSGKPDACTIIELDGNMEIYAIGCVDPMTEFVVSDNGDIILGKA